MTENSRAMAAAHPHQHTLPGQPWTRNLTKEKAVSRREVVILTDDLDGTDHEVRTVAFSFERGNYQIDLSGPNRDRFAAALAPFIAAARPHSDRQAARTASGTRSAAADRSAFNRRVREWSASQGEPIADRGRVPQTAVDAYHAAGLR